MEKPNIIFIVIDALRPKNLSMFDYEKETDKNLKKIAKESILFRNYFSTSNSTAPALNSIFTGLYPPNHGILHQFPYNSDDEFIKVEQGYKFWLPTYFKNKGYETIGIDWIGMWFKTDFDYYEEKEEKTKKFLNIPFIKKILLNMPAWAYKLGKKIIKTRASVQFSPAIDTANLAITKMKESRKPFFLFMHFWDTHFPYPTTEYNKKTNEKDINKILDKIETEPQKEYFKKRVADINLDSTTEMISKYDESIRNVDEAIGRVYKFLKKEKILDNTIIVIQGDHGDSLKEHNIFFEHSGLYEESIHVPCILHLPGIPSKEINGLAQNVDIIPTIKEFLDDNSKDELDGISLMPLIKYNKEVREKIFCWDGLSKDIKSIRTKDRKIILAKDPFCHLCKSKHHKEKEEYDLIHDKQELNNIYFEKSNLEEDKINFIKNKDNSI